MQSPLLKNNMQSLVSRANAQSTVHTYGQFPSQTSMLGFSPSVNNNTSEVVPVKVESEDTFSALALEETQQGDGLSSLDCHQDGGVQNSWDYGGGVEQDLHSYFSKITEGKDKGKYQCNLCGKISADKNQSFQHVESLHFPG